MKKINKDLILLVIMTLVVFSGITFSYLAFNAIEPQEVNDKVEKKKFLAQQLAKNNIGFYNLPKIQTNVVSLNNRIMHIEMTISIEPSSGIKDSFFKSYEPKILDLIINTVAQKTHEEMNNVSGKIIFSDQIKNGINELTKGNHVRRIFFSTFSVQIQ